MLRLFITSTFGLFLMTGGLAQAPQKDRISTIKQLENVSGWLVPGDNDRRNYQFTLDGSVKRQGKWSLSVRSLVPNATAPNNTFVQQQINVEAYRNRRVRFSVFAKTLDVENVNFWMQISAVNMVVLNDDRMKGRELKGSSDWSRYDIAMDVPISSSIVVLGVSMTGSGQLWIDDLKFEEVGFDVPVTGHKPGSEIEAGSLSFIEFYRHDNPEPYEKQLKAAKEKLLTLPKKPVNLDFEN
ncbi:MAG: hypothetical protein AB7J13_06485 [Pyrinomonadaceae bacterium]